VSTNSSWIVPAHLLLAHIIGRRSILSSTIGICPTVWPMLHLCGNRPRGVVYHHDL